VYEDTTNPLLDKPKIIHPNPTHLHFTANGDESQGKEWGNNMVTEAFRGMRYKNYRPLRSEKGRMPLKCNQWLEKALHSQDAGQRKGEWRDLYQEWLQRYEDEVGQHPADPQRGFRAAIKIIRKRNDRNGNGNG
jgi:hypothetical protein